MIKVFSDLKDRNLIANDEFLRVIYRFFGETVDAEAMLKKAIDQIDDVQGKAPPKQAKSDGDPIDNKFPPIDDGLEDDTPLPKVGK